jgi:outer membrane lipoprotein SlyB
MGTLQRAMRILTVSGVLLTAGACNGGLLGGIFGGGNTQQPTSGQISGTVRTQDIRNQRINVQDNSSGQSYWVQYDNRTQVVFRNQGVPPTSIRQGDNVTVQVQNNGSNTYYTNYVRIN